MGAKKEHEHDPDSFSGLINHFSGALNFFNANGGIGGEDVHMEDENIEVFAASSTAPPPENNNTGDGGGSGCFITTIGDFK